MQNFQDVQNPSGEQIVPNEPWGSASQMLTTRVQNTRAETNNIDVNQRRAQRAAARTLMPKVVHSKASMVTVRRAVGDAPVMKHPEPRTNAITEARKKFVINNVGRGRGKLSCFPPVPPLKRKKSRKQKQNLQQRQNLQQKQKLELEALQKQLEFQQTEFLKTVANPPYKVEGCTYKMVSVVHADNAKLMVHPDDQLRLPRNLPAKSASDLKSVLYDVFDDTIKTIADRIVHLLTIINDQEGTRICQNMFCNMQSELNDKRKVFDDAISEMCIEAATSKDECAWNNKHRKQLELANTQLKREKELLLKKEDILSMELDAAKTKCNELTKLLADIENNRAENLCEQDQLMERTKQSEQINETLKQHTAELQQKNANILKELNEKEHQLHHEITDHEYLKKKSDMLTNLLAAKDRQLADKVNVLQQKDIQLAKLMQIKSELLNEISALKLQLAAKADELDNFRELLRSEAETVKPELQEKINRLEQQEEEYRKVLAERDKELKLQELEIGRLTCENLAQISEKNTTINQIKNELASTSEQYQSLCETLNKKESVMRRHEQEIKLLDESLDRQKLRNTNLKSKNATLETKVSELRTDLARYAAILTGHNGQSLFEPVSAEVALRDRLNRRRMEEEKR